MKPSDIDLLVGALTIDGEARGESQEGRLAVAYSILNRCKARKWWGKNGGDPGEHQDHSIGAVCLKPSQFSCWNFSDPNRKKLEAMYREGLAKNMANKGFRASLKALIDAVDGFEKDPALGATHYVTMRLHETVPPAWSIGKEFIQIGNHRFFKGVA